MSTVDDAQLTAILQRTVAGVTGIPAALVRPRWQPDPPIQPSPLTNWAAVGVLARRPTDYPYGSLEETPPFDLTGRYVQQRHEFLDAQVSFYGPSAGANAGALRDALYVGQNRWDLESYGIRVRELGEARSAPELVATAWLNRVDLDLTLVRQENRAYAIPALVGGEIQIVSDADFILTVDVTPPPS